MRLLAAGVLLGALALAAPRALLARGGGGDSYSGGSRSSSGGSYSSDRSYSSESSPRSGSSSGGGGGFRLMTAAEVRTWLKFMGGLLSLVIVFGGLVAAADARAAASRRRAAAAARQAAAAALQELRSRDPRFSPEAFLARAEAVFKKVQEAWSEGDMTPVVHLLSDGVFERFQLLLELQRREGRRNAVDQVRVHQCSVAQMRPGARYDVIDVRIDAACRDRYLSVKGGKLLKESSERFQEYWGFVRSAAARTKAAPAEGHCPNCGSALAVNDSAVCPQCKSWVDSGEFDWVVAEITQSSAWRAGAARDGLKTLPADPETTVQGLEDRASMLFWRWQRCLSDAKPAALEGWCTEAGLRSVMASGVGKFRYEDCGVGAVTVSRSAVKGGLEQVEVRVRWAGRRAKNGSKPGKSKRRATVIALARNAGVRAVPHASLRSAHCAGCGAAILPAGVVCAHCGQGFRDPAAGWVVTALKTRG
ncbi:hypothetical protein EPO15_00125 [bacterium]|nr:MAG: hypothetical protein EPO15_00125 [bacterium]